MTKGIFIQLLGYIGLICMMLSFQMKDKSKILLYQLISGCFFCIHLFLLGAMSGALINAVVSVRSYVYYKRDRMKGVNHIAILYLFVFAFLMSGVLTYDGLYTLIPAFAMISNSFSTWYGNGKVIRLVGLILCPFWFTYDWIVGSWPGMTNDIFMAGSIVIGMIRHDLNLRRGNIGGE